MAIRNHFGLVRPASTLLAVFVLLAGLAVSAQGSTRSDLHSARGKLATIEHRIAGQQGQLATLRDQLSKLGGQVSQAAATLKQTQADIASTERSIGAALARQKRIQGELDALARDAYMEGPGSGLEVILGATSFGDLNDRVQFVSQIGTEDANLAMQAKYLGVQLRLQKDNLVKLRTRQELILSRLRTARNAKVQTIAQEQGLIQQLTNSRQSLVETIAGLKKKIRQEELAKAQPVFQGASSTTYGGWAAQFLPSLGAPICTNNLVAVVSWQVAEFTQAAWNPLATTYPMPGSSTFNYAGVQNYTSLGQGLQATDLTLSAPGHGYEAIVAALGGCVDPMATANAINASGWCNGCGGGTYVTRVVPLVQANYAEYAGL